MAYVWICVSIVLLFASSSEAREWTARSGDYSLEAELVGFDDYYVVLQRADMEMGIAKIDDLSVQDQKYLASETAEAIHEKNLGGMQTWVTADGQKLVGRIVDFASRDVTVQRRRGRVYVNDRLLNSLPDFYRQLIPQIVSHFDEIDLPDQRAFQNWVLRQRGVARTFQVNGVIFESENGDEYAVPFFVFDEKDHDWLTAGWAEWKISQIDAELQASDDLPREQAFMLQTLAAAHFRNQEIQTQIAKMNLNLSAVRVGLTSAWEVTLYPQPGNPLPPQWVVALGRDSDQAIAAALNQNPGFMVGTVRRVSR
ncbi:hypothetical protein C5Y96_02440 [Blastopirellula marina]|uniref:SLA1 homology domain-containing protein n=1 Tax=Blastopirellula marina TaxID=124 RepID=A0A2S8G2T2_9BACT|nr:MULTISPECIES: SHD1 domain-containing protein [Pirellulaceae]PQO38759.1 hypothetical protein C5Y96_02440 [Blastopirellula marina]RCS55067.1 hypothetical protein DTL36_02445 [Bremerella cremea]